MGKRIDCERMAASYDRGRALSLQESQAGRIDRDVIRVTGLVGRPQHRSRRTCSRFALQLDEDDMGRRAADVLPGVRLGVQPPDLARSETHIAGLVGRDESAVEPAQSDHHAVGMVVRARRRAKLVAVLEHAYPIVLEDDRVLVGIGVGRIRHAALLSCVQWRDHRSHHESVPPAGWGRFAQPIHPAQGTGFSVRAVVGSR